MCIQSLLEHQAKQLAFERVRANVRICDDRRIDLASHHEDGPPDPVTFLPIAGQKCPKRLLCNAPHQALASVHYSGVRFQFSHPRVVWLSGFRKSRIGQLDSVHIRELRRIESLRTACGLNLAGIKLILDLMNEVEYLRAEVRFRRG